MLDKLLGAIAIVLVIEGLMPLMFPTSWRQLFGRMLALRDGQLRFVGLASVVSGLVLAVVVAM